MHLLLLTRERVEEFKNSNGFEFFRFYASTNNFFKINWLENKVAQLNQKNLKIGNE